MGQLKRKEKNIPSGKNNQQRHKFNKSVFSLEEFSISGDQKLKQEDAENQEVEERSVLDLTNEFSYNCVGSWKSLKVIKYVSVMAQIDDMHFI